MGGRPRTLTALGREETLKAAALLPLVCVDFRTPVSRLITCSDASTMGGGMCASAGLTPYGESVLKNLETAGLDSEAFRPQGCISSSRSASGPGVLIISLFDGIGALMCALGRLPCVLQGYASSEVDKHCT